MESIAAVLMLAGLGPIVLGIAVFVALRLVSEIRDFSQGDPLHTTLTVVAWVLIGVGLLASCVLLLTPAGFLLWMAILVVVAEVFIKHRVAQQYALLWALTVAAERLIPLIPAIESFADERGGAFAVRARRLAEMLTHGVPLPDALHRSPGLLPPDALPIIRTGYEAGALAPALRQAASARDLRRGLWLSLAGKLIYLCGLLWFGMGMVIFVMLQIIPAFRKIFQDFEAVLPPMTETLISVSSFCVRYWFLFSLLLMAIFLLFVYAILRYVGCIQWTLPGTYWLVRRLDTAVILDALALAAQRQRPLAEALAGLARSYPRRAARRRLQAVVRDLHAGADWCASLFAHGLIKRADLAILRAAGRVGNLPWALKEMADSNRRRLGYRLQALVQMLFPPVVLAIGALVMFTVVSLFMPLIALIENLTQQ